MKSILFMPFDFRLHEGEGAAAAPAAPAEAGTPAEAKSKPSIVYGKQATGAAEPAQETAPDTEALRKEFRELTTGKFKDIYTEETQRMINRRFADDSAMRQRMEQMQKTIDIVAQRYGVEDGDLQKVTSALENDDRMIREQADAAGMSVDQFKEFQRLQRENKALQAQQRGVIEQQMFQQKAEGWYREAIALQQKFPTFDLRAEMQDRDFVDGLNKGVPMEILYKSKYFDQFVGAAAQNAAAQAQKATVDNIRAKGQRPTENGNGAQAASLVKDDVSKLTKKDRANIAKLVAAGETIVF